jgi:co-chaperonin GroES (HSP10)
MDPLTGELSMKLRPLHDRVVSVAAKKKRKPLAVSFCLVRLPKKPTSGEVIVAAGPGRDSGKR